MDSFFKNGVYSKNVRIALIWMAGGFNLIWINANVTFNRKS